MHTDEKWEGLEESDLGGVFAEQSEIARLLKVNDEALMRLTDAVGVLYHRLSSVLVPEEPELAAREREAVRQATTSALGQLLDSHTIKMETETLRLRWLADRLVLVTGVRARLSRLGQLLEYTLTYSSATKSLCSLGVAGFGPRCESCGRPQAQFMLDRHRACVNARLDLDGRDRQEFWSAEGFCQCHRIGPKESTGDEYLSSE